MCTKERGTIHAVIRRESVGNIRKQELRKIAYRNQSNGLFSVKCCHLEGCKCLEMEEHFKMNSCVQ